MKKKTKTSHNAFYNKLFFCKVKSESKQSSTTNIPPLDVESHKRKREKKTKTRRNGKTEREKTHRTLSTKTTEEKKVLVRLVRVCEREDDELIKTDIKQQDIQKGYFSFSFQLNRSIQS